jgi:hypothetical protein
MKKKSWLNISSRQRPTEPITRRYFMDSERLGRLTPGAVLVVLGLCFLLSRFIPTSDWFWLLAAGVVFLVAYSLTRGHSFLVPGCVLASLGAGLFLDGGESWGFIPLGLGVGFLAIFFMDLISSHISNWWSLILGGVLMAIGLVDLARLFTLIPGSWWSFWPLILIVIGLFMIYRQSEQST